MGADGLAHHVPHADVRFLRRRRTHHQTGDRAMRRLALVATLTLVLSVAVPASAQCIMCSTGAHAAGAKTERSLLHGVLVLLVPPVSMMAGLIGLAFFYKRDQ